MTPTPPVSSHTDLVTRLRAQMMLQTATASGYARLNRGNELRDLLGQAAEALSTTPTQCGWMLIETAPKDFVVDLWVNHPDYKDGGYRSVNCHWDAAAEEFVDALGNYINGMKRGGAWLVYPSFWRSIPNPPAAISQSKE